MRIKKTVILTYALSTLNFAFRTSAQAPPTNAIVPSTRAVMTDSNSVLKQPTNFFAANSNLLNAVVAAGGAGTNAATLSGSQTFSGAKAFTNTGNSYTGNGSGLTSLTAGNLSGQVPLANLLSAVHTNGMTGAATFSNKVNLANGGLKAYAADNSQDPTANSAHSLITSNGVDNVLTLINYDNSHFSALVCADYSNQWHSAFGWGNPNTNTGTPYPQMNYWESLFHDYAGFVTGGELEFGMDGGRTGGTPGDFIRWKSGSTNVANALVVSRISGNGTLSIASNLNVGGITTLSNSLNSTSFLQGTRFSATQGNVALSTQVGLDLGNNDSGVNYEISSPGGIAMLTFGITGAYTFCTTSAAQGWNGFPSVDIGTDIANGNTIGNAMLKAHGSFGTDTKTKSANYTATMGDSVILVSSSGKTITLPDATFHCAGRIYTVKLTVSGSATVATTSSQNIDGATTFSLSAQYKYVTVQSDGTQWWVIANN